MLLLISAISRQVNQDETDHGCKEEYVICTSFHFAASFENVGSFRIVDSVRSMVWYESNELDIIVE